LNRRDILLLLLCSVGLVLAFPPFPTGFIACIALVPFFFFLEGKRLWEAFRGGYLVGLIWVAGTFYWVGWATVIGFFGSLLWMPLSFALFSVLQRWLWIKWGKRSLFAAPILWAGGELLFSFGELGQTWLSLAYTQTYFPQMIQYISITGMYGIVLWVVLINVLFFFCIDRSWIPKKKLYAVSGVILLFLIPLFVSLCSDNRTPISEDEIHIALIQGNIDPYIKWTPSFIDSNFTVYSKMTADVVKQKPDLIVWPETASPCYLQYRFEYLNRVRTQIDSLEIPLLTGALDFKWIEPGKTDRFNAALFLQPKRGRIESYHKINLVPFSEKVPFSNNIPLLHTFLRKCKLDVGNFTPGDSISIFTFQPRSRDEPTAFSVIICYESVFPYLVRQFVRDGAEFLVIITNDGWFGHTSGPYQHAQMAVLRAIENRVWIARCANTGISEFIDPYGKIHKKTNLNQAAALVDTIHLNQKKTFFVLHGTLFIWLIGFGNTFILIVTFLRKKKNVIE